MTSTSLHEFLRTRRSVRRFRPERVPAPVVERMLTSATYAPSAHNRQPWRFCIISSMEVKHCLAEAMEAEFRRDLATDGLSKAKIEAQIERSHKRITSAPLVIVLSMDLSEMDRYSDRRRAAERTMAVQSVAAAGMQLLLAAHAEGLGGVWVCSPLFAPEAVRETLKLPIRWEPQAMFFIGYPTESPPPREKKALKDISIFAMG